VLLVLAIALGIFFAYIAWNVVASMLRALEKIASKDNFEMTNLGRIRRIHGFGLFTVNQDERAVKTAFGRAQRLPGTTLDDPIADRLRPEERERYAYPMLRVLPPGGPYIVWPWEIAHVVNIATLTVNMAFDPENRAANRDNTVLEAVTKDQLNTGLTGQIRYRVSDRNLYAYLFGVKNPTAHIMGYFVSILRERIANFEAPPKSTADGGAVVAGISINDLRKNLRDLNERMDEECSSSSARYGVVLDASLITAIDPPQDVESALAAINTAYNEVSSEISVAQATADQTIVQSRRAVEIQTLRAQAEVEPLVAVADQVAALKKSGGAEAVDAYRRYVRLGLLENAGRIIKEAA
jgi:regulator of protease activity HflC (stomatin/prohibitin superfamily)